jgi:hypothetical protein
MDLSTTAMTDALRAPVDLVDPSVRVRAGPVLTLTLPSRLPSADHEYGYAGRNRQVAGSSSVSSTLGAVAQR